MIRQSKKIKLQTTLTTLDETIISLQQTTEEIEKWLFNYNIDSDQIDGFINLIESRHNLVVQLNKQSKQLEDLEHQLSSNDFIDFTHGLDDIKNRIVKQLGTVIEKDAFIRTRIAELQNTLLQKSIVIKKGKKFANTYDVFPHRKAMFVDVR